MVLEDGAVVVEDGEAALGVDVEVVGGARVVVVVDDGRDQRREDLQVRQPVLEEWTRDQSRFKVPNIAHQPIFLCALTLKKNKTINLRMIS